MTRQNRRWGLGGAPACVLAFAFAIASLAACDRGAAPSAGTPAAAAGGSAQNASVVPQPAEAQASGRSGPADASTAIGGVVTNQGSNNAATGSKPAPTAGDGAASAASR
jgi:hypothetical protein